MVLVRVRLDLVSLGQSPQEAATPTCARSPKGCLALAPSSGHSELATFPENLVVSNVVCEPSIWAQYSSRLRLMPS
eukprot:COSAG06_NODE_498_length_15000_cov_60.875721_15_plen_76_part_00